MGRVFALLRRKDRPKLFDLPMTIECCGAEAPQCPGVKSWKGEKMEHIALRYTDRKPVYTEGRKYRIVSMANGQWQRQMDRGVLGTNKSDPWLVDGPIQDRTSAIRALSIRGEIEE
jgi:hypothetical protein